jgi:hypothetical protein
VIRNIAKPTITNDIQLGDIITSKPVENYNGVIQHDYGKAVQLVDEHIEQPLQGLLTHMSQLQAKNWTGGLDDVLRIVWEALEQSPDMKDRFSLPNSTRVFFSIPPIIMFEDISRT